MEKILATLYLIGVFFTAFVFLFFYINNLIDKWNNRNKAAENQPEPISEPAFDIVGKSKSALLVPLVFEKNELKMNETLIAEPISAAETEPDISPEDVDVTMTKPYIPDDDELEQFRNDDVGVSEVFSQGLTYQQICQALDVVEGKKSGEDAELVAGETFCLMPSDFLDMICTQPDYENMVKKLISCYVDAAGNNKPQSAIVADFDIKNYV
jgi:hypothetical protein